MCDAKCNWRGTQICKACMEEHEEQALYNARRELRQAADDKRFSILINAALVRV